MKFRIARAIRMVGSIGCIWASHRLEAQSATPDSSLIIEYGGPIQRELNAGQILTLRPSLRNVSSQRVAIAHGTRFFVLDALFAAPRAKAEPQANYKFPRADTWGEVSHLEYPNPSAVYTLPLITRTLEPGEAYAPALLYQKSEYSVPFDSSGVYRIRVCAYLIKRVICGLRDISVTVR